MKAELEELISKEAIQRSLKNKLRPHRIDYWCLPNKADANFVACIEDILGLYELPYDSNIPIICMDGSRYSCAGVPLFRRNGYRQSSGRKPLFRNRDTALN